MNVSANIVDPRNCLYGNNSIDLWFVNSETVDLHALLEACQTFLSEEELARGDRFRSSRHRRDYLITRLLVRATLAERLGVPAQTLHFGTNEYGRPHLLADPELSFNVSHTDGLILLAIANAGYVGVDVERLQSGRATLPLAQYCFAACELAVLRAIPASRFDEAFMSYWTLKESYIKAKGTGLSTALDSFAFDLNKRELIGFTPPPQDADEVPAHFWLLRPTPNHLCAICALQCPRPPVLNAWNVVPFISKSAATPSVLRRSTG